MDTKQTAQDADAAARVAAAAEERRLWLLLSDAGTPPTDRVKAYASWLEATRTSKELGAAPETGTRPGNGT